MRNRTTFPQAVRVFLKALVAFMAAFFFATSAAGMPEPGKFKTVGTTELGPMVEIGPGVQITDVIPSFAGMYRMAMQNDDDPDNDKDELNWEVIYAANRSTRPFIPTCPIKKNGAAYRKDHSEVGVWDNCPRESRRIATVAGHSGRFVIPIKSVITINDKVDCYDNAACLEKRLTKLNGQAPAKAAEPSPVEINSEPVSTQVAPDQEASTDCLVLSRELENLKLRNQELENRPTSSSNWVFWFLAGLGFAATTFKVLKAVYPKHPMFRSDDELKKRLQAQADEIASLLAQRHERDIQILTLEREFKASQDRLQELFQNEKQLGQELASVSRRAAALDQQLIREQKQAEPNPTYAAEQPPLRESFNKARTQQLQSALDEAKAMIANLVTQAAYAKIDNETLKAAITELTQTNLELHDEFVRFDAEAAAFSKEATVQIKEYEEEIPRSIRSAEAAIADKQAMEEKLRVVEVLLSSRDQALTQYAAKIEALELKISELQASGGIVDDRFAVLDGIITELRGSLEGSSRQRLETAYGIIRKQQQGLEELLAKAKEERASDSGSSSKLELERDLSDARQANAAQRDRIAELDGKLNGIIKTMRSCVEAHATQVEAQRAKTAQGSSILEEARLSEATEYEGIQMVCFYQALSEATSYSLEAITRVFAPSSEGPQTARGLGHDQPGRNEILLKQTEDLDAQLIWLNDLARRELPLLVTPARLTHFTRLFTLPAICAAETVVHEKEEFRNSVLGDAVHWRLYSLMMKLNRDLGLSTLQQTERPRDSFIG